MLRIVVHQDQSTHLECCGRELEERFDEGDMICRECRIRYSLVQVRSLAISSLRSLKALAESLAQEISLLTTTSPAARD